MPALPPSFLFRVCTPIARVAGEPAWKLWDELTPVSAGGDLDADPPPLAVRAGWDEEGLLVGCEVTGKSKPAKGDLADPQASDSVVVCVDTRDTKTIRRAGRFCHRFRLIPADPKGKPAAYLRQEPVPRAREDAAFGPMKGEAISEVSKSGYRILARVAADNLTGYDPTDSPKIGFYVVLQDAEHGVRPMSGDEKLPVDADPSFWTTVELAIG